MIRIGANLRLTIWCADERVRFDEEAFGTLDESLERRALIYLEPHFESGLVHVSIRVKTPKKRVSLKYFWLADLHSAGAIGTSLVFKPRKAMKNAWAIRPVRVLALARHLAAGRQTPLMWRARVNHVELCAADVRAALVLLDQHEERIA